MKEINNENIKEILKIASELVLTRKGDITTESGDVATVDIDTINRLDYLIAQAFNLDSDDVNFENIEILIEKIKAK